MFSRQPSLSQRTKSTYRQQQQWTAKSQGPGLGFVIVVVCLLVLLGASAGEALLLSMTGSLYPEGYTTACAAGAAVSPTRKSGSPLNGLGNEVAHDDAAPLAPPVLELITPDGCASSSFSETSSLVMNIQKAVAGGVSLVQLRDYKSGAKSKADLAVRISTAIEGRALFVVNGEPDAARASGADGVHLPERMMDRLVGLRGQGEWPRIVGCSVHSVAAAVEAARLGADYVQVGTMFATQSHPGKTPEGVGMLNDVRRQLQVEGLDVVLVLGVGGIDASNCGDVVAAGGDGVAAIRCLCSSSDAEGQARRIMQDMRNSAGSRFAGSLGDEIK
ncbi:unnamed protein product [Ectocarpus sp. 8 AP-2014]